MKDRIRINATLYSSNSNMKSYLISILTLFLSIPVFSQEQYDEYITVYREDDNGELYEDSMLECSKFFIQKVKNGMTADQVKEITGDPSESFLLTNEISKKKAEIWHYTHSIEIDHSIEFVDDKVEDVILDYQAYQKEIKEMMKKQGVELELE